MLSWEPSVVSELIMVGVGALLSMGPLGFGSKHGD